VDVVVGLGRHVEVDDVRQRLDVDAARGDVGGDEHAVAAGLEAASASVRCAWLRLPWMRAAAMPRLARKSAGGWRGAWCG
jgi:hypothetical protein